LTAPAHGKLHLRLFDAHTDWDEIEFSMPDANVDDSPRAIAIADIHDEFVRDMESFAVRWREVDSRRLQQLFQTGDLHSPDFTKVRNIASSLDIDGCSEAVVQLKAMILHHFMYLREYRRTAVPDSIWAPFLSYAMLDEQTTAFLKEVRQVPAPSDRRIVDLDRNGAPIILQLAPVINAMFRSNVHKTHLRAKGQMWTIKFRDEQGDDAIGLTLEVFALAADSIFDENSELVVRRGDHQGFVPFSARHGRDIYYAIGILMAMIVRNGWVQDLAFDEIVWKFLGSTQQLTREDVLGADPSLRAQVNEWQTTQSARWEFEMWNGQKTPLGTSGGRPVPRDRIPSYIDQVIHNRISSLKQFLEPMKEGFWENIGRGGQAKATPEILKRLALGSGEVSARELMGAMKVKQGEGIRDEDMERLGRVLERFTATERRQFLTFVASCPRLPNAKLNPDFVITVGRPALGRGENPDTRLPIAHTCTFKLELPPYSSDEIAYQKIQQAITMCRTMELV
jgi:hypothetical protein